MRALKTLFARIWNDSLAYITNNWKKVAVIAAIIVTIIVVVYLAALAFKGFVNLTSVEKTGIDYKTLIHKIRELSKLEVAELIIVDKADWKKVKKLFGFIKISEAKAAYIIRGHVIATVDLSNVDETSVKVDGKKVTIRIPDPTLGVVSLEVMDIYNVDNGVFVKITPEDTVKAMEDIKDQLKRSALYRYGILEKARKSARKFMENFIKAFGFEDVEVIFASVRKAVR